MSFRQLDRPPLDPAALRTALVRPEALWSDLRVSERTNSTNADAAALAREGAPEGLIVTTGHQRAGRGRLDRQWDSPEGAGIAVSVVLRPDAVPLARWVWLPLLTGLAVDATVKEFGVDSSLKWPNDVLVHGRKLCGILLERVESAAGPAAIVGIGLNVSLTRAELPVDTATSLLLEGAVETDRTIILRALLRNLASLYRTWRDAGGDPGIGMRDSYIVRCSTIGTSVRVSLPDGGILEGLASGIDESGRLIVDGRALSAGDVTHVRPASADS